MFKFYEQTGLQTFVSTLSYVEISEILHQFFCEKWNQVLQNT